MKKVAVTVRRIGNSRGIVIPKPLLSHLGLEEDASAELSIEDDALVLRKATAPIRVGWAEAVAQIAQAGDDALVMGEFPNADDTDLQW
jgi:antitoxin MazE